MYLSGNFLGTCQNFKRKPEALILIVNGSGGRPDSKPSERALRFSANFCGI
jgi:hypothetical protein